jgi:hypothetical protein
MSVLSIRAQLKTLLQTVSGIGQVYDYKRYSADWGSYKQLFTKNSRVNEWEIQRTGFTVEPRGSQAAAGKVKDLTHTFILRGFYGFQDEPSSEKDFDTLVDAISDLFITHQDIDQTAEIINIPVVGQITFQMFGDVLCHVIEIQVSVRERTFL